MKQTRKIFVLNGYSHKEEKLLLEKLKFKALTVFKSKYVTFDEFGEVFKNNKNALCISCNLPVAFMRKAIICDSLDFDSGIIEQFQKIADAYNCDIGDHISNSSGLNGIPTINDCGYCQYLQGNQKVFQHKILYSSSNFFVVSTLGQFINGYLLIIPYSHIMSNAELNKSMQEEFLTVLEDISYILKMTYNVPNVLVWENRTGSSGVGKAKNSIVHAHTHIAPSKLDAKTIEIISAFPFKTIGFDEISNYSKDSYLLIKETDQLWKICQDSNLYIPRQYIRQLIAEERGIPNKNWDWRIHPYVDKKQETDKQFFNTLKKNWNQLPERIRYRTRDHLI